ncbi:MAG TPA: phosphoribosyltransferase family protein [Burkholderiaceae bacterium]|nr:phosphoribosyltransferase family protein [Burkholderiaceae bacterium]
MSMRFRDRADAAARLAERLKAEHLAPPCVVLALPRGGVPIGAAVARALGAPLDLLLVRKIGAPGQRELAVGALVDGDPPELLVDERLAALTGADAGYIDAEVRAERRELERRRARYLGGRRPLPVQGATVVVVDDGIATGTTMRAVLRALRRRDPAHLVLAVPVAPPDTVRALRAEVDRVVCLVEPEPFHAIGLHYADFHQVSDEEVLAALAEAEPPARRVRREGPPTA